MLFRCCAADGTFILFGWLAPIYSNETEGALLTRRARLAAIKALARPSRKCHDEP
jgi:hypothetical protein